MQKIFKQEIRFKDEYGHNFPDWKMQKMGDVFDEVSRKVGSKTLNTYSITAGVGFVSQKKNLVEIFQVTKMRNIHI